MSAGHTRPSHGWTQATSEERICQTPSCHSREDVQAVTTLPGGETEVLLLCDQCRKYYLGVSS